MQPSSFSLRISAYSLQLSTISYQLILHKSALLNQNLISKVGDTSGMHHMRVSIECPFHLHKDRESPVISPAVSIFLWPCNLDVQSVHFTLYAIRSNWFPTNTKCKLNCTLYILSSGRTLYPHLCICSWFSE